MKKLLLYGWFGAMNLGDDAMLSSISKYLKENYGEELEISIITNNNPNFIIDDHFFLDYLHKVDNPINKIMTTRVSKSKYIRKLEALFKCLILITKVYFNKDLNPFKEYDALIFIGGGYINSIWRFAMLEIYFLIILCKIKKMPIYFTGQTAGPYYNKIDKLLSKIIYKNGKKILTREIYSYNELLNMNLKNVISSADDFYLMPFENDVALKNRNTNKRYFICNIKDFNKYDLFYDKFISIVIKICMLSSLNIVFVPFGYKNGPNDLKYIEKYESILKDKKINYEIYIPNNLDDLLRLYKNSNFTLGMAYHSIVLSLFCDVPAYSVYYGDYYKRKISGIFQHYNLIENAIDISHTTDIEISKFIEKIILNNEQNNNEIKNITKRLKSLCKFNWDNIIEEILYHN